MRGCVSGALAAAATCGLLVFAGAAHAAFPIVLDSDGKTAPVYSYANAIRERVWVEPIPAIDQDANGVPDRVALEIMRPAETAPASGLHVPAIIYPSPYLTSLGEGSDFPGKFLQTTGGVASRFPMFYDNYFVPRGYAVILAEANGTAFSTGCPLHGGPGDIASMKAVIDWLQGRDAQAKGYTAATGGSVVPADWDNGKAAMIGKSYSGTLPTGVAATGVPGLTTIVPISAIARWYDYSRSNGVRFSGTHYPAVLSQLIVDNDVSGALGVVPPDRTTICAPSRATMSTSPDPLLGDGDATGDLTPFWQARDYTTNMANVHASVLLSFGLNDDNVKVDHFTNWWAGLAANDVPRKLWLSQEGHVDPFFYRRAAWVDTLHRWFDYWLYDVQNGIMSKPRVTIERSTNVWEEDADWPLPGTSNVDVFLNGSAAAAAGTLGAFTGGGSTDSLAFTDLTTQTEAATIALPDGLQTNRRVFLSPVLRRDVHLSGVPKIDLRASFNKTSAYLGALLVDYSATPFTSPTRSGEGISFVGAPNNCWGEEDPARPTDVRCFAEPIKPTSFPTSWLVSNAIFDVQNRDSLSSVTPLVAGLSYRLTVPLIGNDYVFAAGHRIGVIVVSSYKDYRSGATVVAAVVPPLTVTVDTRLSKIMLPVVGGNAAARKSGIYLDTTKPALTLASPAPVEATGPSTAVSFSASATDDLDDAPGVACAPASGSAFTVGSTTVSCTATDASGNATSGSFAVLVKDTTAPTLSLPAPIKVEAEGAVGAKVSYAAGAADVADPSPAVSCLPASGSTFALVTTTVTCSASDAAGNTAGGSFAVTVADTVAPVLTAPRTVTANANSGKGVKVSYRVTASDTVDASVAVSCRPAAGALFKIGRTVVSCTAADDAANSAKASITIVVLGAADQLKALRAKLAKQRGGKALVKQVNAVLTALAGHRTAKACTALAALKRSVRTASARGDLTRIGKLMRC
ncbi:MAG: CocE/NonD family hydrolase [Gaiellaceae bacterium]